MSEYWIGDWVKVISSGKKGKYEGCVNNKFKIKINNKLFIISKQDIELLPENEIPKDKLVAKKTSIDNKTIVSRPYVSIIDLHIEKLSPQMQNELPELIISYQIKRAKAFILESINRRQLSVTIIHGKGIGALKMEVESLLKSFNQVYFTKIVNNGGAVEVMFQY